MQKKKETKGIKWVGDGGGLLGRWVGIELLF